MPLIKCPEPECQRMVSDEAESCPGCGCRVRGRTSSVSIGAGNVSEEARVLITGRGSFPTLQAAIDAAQEGDELCLGPGTFNEAITIHKSLTIRSKDTQAVPILTAIDADVITISGIATVSLQGVVVKPTTASVDPTAAKAAVAVNPSDGNSTSPNLVTLNLRDCQIFGELVSHFTKLTVTRCLVAGPSFVDVEGDKVLQYTGIKGWKSDMFIVDSIISNFKQGVFASDSSFRGEKRRIRDCDGCITATEAPFHLSDFEFDRCGSGISINQPTSLAVIENGRVITGKGGTAVEIRRGKASLSGIEVDGYHRGLEVTAKSDVTAVSCSFMRCNMNGVTAGGDSSVMLDRCTVAECYNGTWSQNNSTITTLRCTFRNNKNDSYVSRT